MSARNGQGVWMLQNLNLRGAASLALVIATAMAGLGLLVYLYGYTAVAQTATASLLRLVPDAFKAFGILVLTVAGALCGVLATRSVADATYIWVRFQDHRGRELLRMESARLAAPDSVVARHLADSGYAILREQQPIALERPEMAGSAGPARIAARQQPFPA
jgi:hypothetical protein